MLVVKNQERKGWYVMRKHKRREDGSAITSTKQTSTLRWRLIFKGRTFYILIHHISLPFSIFLIPGSTHSPSEKLPESTTGFRQNPPNFPRNQKFKVAELLNPEPRFNTAANQDRGSCSQTEKVCNQLQRTASSRIKIIRCWDSLLRLSKLHKIQCIDFRQNAALHSDR
jgi:hypothetical protein